MKCIEMKWQFHVEGFSCTPRLYSITMGSRAICHTCLVGHFAESMLKRCPALEDGAVPPWPSPFLESPSPSSLTAVEQIWIQSWAFSTWHGCVIHSGRVNMPSTIHCSSAPALSMWHGHWSQTFPCHGCLWSNQRVPSHVSWKLE